MGESVGGAAALEVWGDPIAHSKSPLLHAAAYRALGLEWRYERRRVSEDAFAGEFATEAPRLRGLSLTMPLKAAAFAAAETRDQPATLTGAANTLLLTGGMIRAFNTDVGGIVRAFAARGVDHLDTARIIGAGATATSALVALAHMGATRVEVLARRPAAAAPLQALGTSMGVTVVARNLRDAADATSEASATVATLPGDAALDPAIATALASGGGVLMDVVYGTWPTPLALAWEAHGLPSMSGEAMLLHQALLQVRVFTTGDPATPLPNEDAILAEMRSALMGD